jgi:Ca-activated chloride channel homolog
MRSWKRRMLSLLLLACLAWTSCGKNGSDSGAPPAAGDPNALTLVFAYGSEKEAWIKQATATFNGQRNKAPSGKLIVVDAIPMGSGESVDDVLAGRRQAHLVSPASGVFVTLGNAQSRAQTGRDLVGPTQNLVLSPVVIALWRPMAEALGWGTKPIGWADIAAVAENPQGWAAYGHPEWGTFKFGHTHPEYSNSGLIYLIAGAYGAAAKQAGLTLADVRAPVTAKHVSALERSVVHYGSSTGFFATKMFANDPGYLSAAVLYESNVVDSYDPKYASKPFPVVAVYPKEGTFWSDHPIAVVDREWVTDDHRAAAKTYVDFLLGREQQTKALAFGFRPGDPAVAVGAPIDAAHGVDPVEPKTTLEVPPADVVAALVEVWRANKRATNVTLVIDTSGSMKAENKMENAKAGALEFVKLLTRGDTVSVLAFNFAPSWVARDVPLATGRAAVERAISGLFANGGTALYDATIAAYGSMSDHRDQSKISAIVVLSDGADTDSSAALEQILGQIRFDGERRPVRVFTIGYGKEARRDVLERIADATQARYFDGKPEDIRVVFREISTFF